MRYVLILASVLLLTPQAQAQYVNPGNPLYVGPSQGYSPSYASAQEAGVLRQRMQEQQRDYEIQMRRMQEQQRQMQRNNNTFGNPYGGYANW